MPASTNRLSLYLPGGGSSGLITPDETFDIDKINDNMRKIDSAVGATICTSTTRPSVPYPGQHVYETDTKAGLVWDGDSWEPFGPDDTGWVGLTLKSGYARQGGLNITARRYGSVVYTRGRLNRTGGSSTAFEYPEGMRPAAGLGAWPLTPAGAGSLQQCSVDSSTGGFIVGSGQFTDLGLVAVSFLVG